MGYQILKGIPMPDPVRTTKYPFDVMGVGDMFFVPADQEDPTAEDMNALRKRMSGAASMAGKRLGKAFSTQMITNDGKLGVGVWRTG